MKRLLLMCLLAGIVMSSCAATPLVISATAPTTDNESSCGAPVSPRPIFAPNLLEVLFVWNGPVSDSLRVSNVNPGDPVIRQLNGNAPSGNYTVMAYIEKMVNGAKYQSCPAQKLITICANPDTLVIN